MIFRRLRRKPGDLQADPQPMTPMIDVVFQLLIFFMLSMHFKEVEGKLLSQIPKREGLDPSHISDVLKEVRIFICADGNLAQHRHDKGTHEKRNKPGEVCRIAVESQEFGEVFSTERHPAKMLPNRTVYRAAGETAARLYALIPSTPDKPAKLILDADSEVPYEHVVGIVNACQERGALNVEFAGNPRWEKYYGTGQRTGAYDRGR